MSINSWERRGDTRCRPSLSPRKGERRACGTERRGADRLDLGLYPPRPERDDSRFNEIGRPFQVLQGAAPANAEVRADRRDPVKARPEHGKQLGPVATGRDRDPDTLAGQGEGDVDRAIGAIGHAVAPGAEARDFDLTLHDGRRSRIPRCRCWDGRGNFDRRPHFG
jgi:hypothetical protein